MKTFLFPLLVGFFIFSSCDRPETIPVEPVALPNHWESEHLIIEPLTDSCWLHTSYLHLPNTDPIPCNGLIYINNQEAIVWDTPASDSAALELIHWVVEQRKARIKYVVATHHHDDCLGSLDIFHQQGVSSLGHIKCLPLATKDSLTAPQLGIMDNHQLLIGTDTVNLFYPGPGHTVDNIVGWIPSQKVLFGGCLVKPEGASKGYLEDANLDTWSSSVSVLQGRYPEAKIVVPGHGKPGDLKLINYTADLFRQDTLRSDIHWRPRKTKDRTTFRFDGFTVQLEGHFEAPAYSQSDTFEIFEDVGWYIYNRRLWVQSENPDDRFEVRAMIWHALYEQYQQKEGSYPSPKEYFAWEATQVKWEGPSDYAFIKDSLPGVWVIPTINSFPYEGKHHGPFSLALKEQMNLRDTFVHYSDEGGMNTSTFVYKEKPCYYRIPYGLLKITRINGAVREDKFIRVHFSYGC